MSRQSLEEALAALPPVWPGDPAAALREAISGSGRKVVAIDDDPTGTQTVHDVPVLADWSVEALAAELLDPGASRFHPREFPQLACSRSGGTESGHRPEPSGGRGTHRAGLRRDQPQRLHIARTLSC
jgi:hypothetical protein